jgi:Holliday junction resolvase-like predicted endonuclease
VKVKYRNSPNWGNSLDAITAKKQSQMSFAAELWVSNNDWQGDYELMAASVGGDPPKIKQIIEL